MYRLMIVEDEDVIRKGISRSLDWESMGFTVFAEAKNGKDALEKLGNESVDVVLTDIKMPIMGGIELAKTIRQLLPDVQIVILSGFSEFEYAREAIRFHAFEYLLKPTNKKKLQETFQHLKVRLDQKREELEHSQVWRAAAGEEFEKRKKEFLLGLLEDNGDTYTNLDTRLEELELDLTGHYYTAALVSLDKKHLMDKVKNSWNNDTRLIHYAIGNIINELLADCPKCESVIKEVDQIAVIFCFDTLKEQDSQMVKVLENIIHYINKFVYGNEGDYLSAGVGITYPTLYQIAKSYRQAQGVLERKFYHSESSIVRFMRTEEDQREQQWIESYPQESRDIIEKVLDGDILLARQLVHDMFARFETMKVRPEIVKDYCCMLQTLLRVSAAGEFQDPLNQNMFPDGFQENVRQMQSLDHLREYVTQVLEQIGENIHQIGEADNNLAIQKAKEYIKTNYEKKISLQDICDEVYLSPNYFSWLFRQETGDTYMNYLQKVRMEKAKELLKDPQLKVYEIASSIGYSSYKYFISQFKKLVGVSPKEYRNFGGD